MSPFAAPLFTPAPWHGADGFEAAFLQTRAGDRLRIGYLPPVAPERGTVLLSCGRSECIEKYAETATELAQRGFGVVLHEWAGQGLSGRYLPDALRAHVVGGYARMLANLDDLIAAVHGVLPAPWIAMGHSMGGGLTALALAQGESRFAAAVLCAPMIGILTRPFSYAVARRVAFTQALVQGSRLTRPQIDPAQRPFEGNPLTHDPVRYARTQALYRNWPELRLGEPTWGWIHYACRIERSLAAPGAAERIACPVTIITAGKERLVDNGAAARFASRLPRGRLVHVPGALHEILMETDEYRMQFWRVFDDLAF